MILAADQVTGWRSLTKGEYMSPLSGKLEEKKDNDNDNAKRTNEIDMTFETPLSSNLGWNEDDDFFNTAPEYLSTFFKMQGSVSSCIIDICSLADQGHLGLTKEGRCRLKFLDDTVKLITKLVSFQTSDVRLFTPFAILLQNISNRMKDVLATLGKIKNVQTTITENFDIFELKLRAHWEEMMSLFPPGAASLASPVVVISDLNARKMWLTSFGDAYYTTFNKFISMVDTEMVMDGKEKLTDRMKECLRYLINFPEDDVITTYKFNQLICLFGLEDFEKNFQQLTERKGFCGLINRIQAYEILTTSPKPHPFLIRMSRTEPRFFAFSYKGKNGLVSHRVNKDNKGQPIQVEKFIRDNFFNYNLVDKQLYLDEIFGVGVSNSPLSEYASSYTGYIH